VQEEDGDEEEEEEEEDAGGWQDARDSSWVSRKETVGGPPWPSMELGKVGRLGTVMGQTNKPVGLLRSRQ
jgi:hypothetical protein